jgi:hypothetical protein
VGWRDECPLRVDASIRRDPASALRADKCVRRAIELAVLPFYRRRNRMNDVDALQNLADGLTQHASTGPSVGLAA